MIDATGPNDGAGGLDGGGLPGPARTGPNVGPHAELRQSQVYAWDGYGVGAITDSGGYFTATREVISIPGAAAGESSLDTLSATFSAARSMLAGALLTPGCSAFEIRYVSLGNQGSNPGRIRMYVTAKSQGSSDLAARACEQAVRGACSALPSGWITAPVPHPGLDTTARETILELRAPEEVTYPQWAHVRAAYLYAVQSVRGDGSGWRGFWQTLARQPEPVCVSLLFRRTVLSAVEKDSLANVTSQLEYYAEAREDYNSIGTPYTAPADENAARALDAWRGRMDALHEPVLSRLSVRARADVAAQVAGALAAAVSGNRATPDRQDATHAMWVEVPVTPADVNAARFSLDNLEVVPWGGHDIWKTSQPPATLRRLPYLLGLNEAAAVAPIPIPDADGAPGFAKTRVIQQVRAPIISQFGGQPVERTDGQVEAGLHVGDLLHEGHGQIPAVLPLSAVNRHVLLSGAPGSGKTTTVMTLLAQLWRDHRIPFLVIESVKTEYRALLDAPGMDDLTVITAGVDDVSPLRLNPLAPPPGVRCESHLVAVLNILKLALPLDQPLPFLLEEALERTFLAAGWDHEDTIDTAPLAPTLRDLLRTFADVFEEKGYVGEARNIGPAMELRLRTLLRGAKGRTFDVAEPSDIADLFRGPVVIELEEIVDPDEKAVFAGMILDRVRAEARRRGASGNELRHVTVLEEAHRVLAGAAKTGTSNTSGDQNPRDAVVDAYTNAMAELRGWGEGFIVCTQSPDRLADAAVAMTGTRIIHRLDSAADRKSLLDDIAGRDSDTVIAARLRTGEALARWPGIEDPVVLKVTSDPGVNTANTLTDDQISQRMAARATTTRALLPFRMCSPTVCVTGCTPAVRRTGSRVGVQIAAGARSRWDAGGPDPTPAIIAAAQAAGATTVETAYCTAAHLAADNVAFHSPPGAEDTRSHLETIIRREIPHA